MVMGEFILSIPIYSNTSPNEISSIDVPTTSPVSDVFILVVLDASIVVGVLAV